MLCEACFEVVEECACCAGGVGVCTCGVPVCQGCAEALCVEDEGETSASFEAFGSLGVAGAVGAVGAGVLVAERW